LKGGKDSCQQRKGKQIEPHRMKKKTKKMEAARILRDNLCVRKKNASSPAVRQKESKTNGDAFSKIGGERRHDAGKKQQKDGLKHG